MYDIIEYDQPAVISLSWLRKETEVGAQRVGSREVSDRAVSIDLYLGRRDVTREPIDHTVRIVRTALRIRG